MSNPLNNNYINNIENTKSQFENKESVKQPQIGKRMLGRHWKTQPDNGNTQNINLVGKKELLQTPVTQQKSLKELYKKLTNEAKELKGPEQRNKLKTAFQAKQTFEKLKNKASLPANPHATTKTQIQILLNRPLPPRPVSQNSSKNGSSFIQNKPPLRPLPKPPVNSNESSPSIENPKEKQIKEFSSRIDNLNDRLDTIQNSIKEGKNINQEMGQIGSQIGNIKENSNLDASLLKKLDSLSKKFQTTALVNEMVATETTFETKLKSAAEKLGEIDQKIKGSIFAKKDPIFADMKIKYQTLNQLSPFLTAQFKEAGADAEKLQKVFNSKNYESYTQTIKEITLGYDKLLKGLDKFSESRTNKKEDGSKLYNSDKSDFITVIQRLPRHEMLINSLAKNADENAKAIFEKTSAFIQSKGKEINEAKGKSL